MKEPDIKLSLEEYNQLLKEKENLQSKLDQALRKSAELAARVSSGEAEIVRLRWDIMDLKRRLWGKSSEKRSLPQDPSQLSICFESPADVADPVAEQEAAVRKSGKSEKIYDRFRKSFTGKITPHARKPIDPRFRREEVVVPMPGDINMEGAVKIGEEVTEQYAVRPAEVYVIRTVRPKYRLADGRIVTAPMPVMAHPRSNASESMLAHIAVAKYADHLPLNRQLDIFERNGVHLSPSTVSNWMMAAAQRIEPVYNELRELVKDSYYVMADETPHPVLENDRPGSLHQGYMWAFYLPERNSPFFEYHRGRGAEGVDTLLAGQVRVVQSDGFTVYNKFDTLPGRLHLCCWAHVRRKFTEARGCDPPRAERALEKIAGLYEVERRIKEEGITGEAAVRLRREESYPLIKELEGWCREEFAKTPAGSPIAQAMSYMYTRFEQLSGYVNDERLQIDNNPVERSIRPLTLNRKNTLFSGSDDAAHAAAVFFSLLGCCKENGVNPKAWLQDVLIRVQDKKYKDINNYSELLPCNWNRAE